MRRLFRLGWHKMRGETVTRRRPTTTTDAWGNTVDGAMIDTPIGGVLVAPGTSSEPVPGRGEVSSATTLFCPPWTDTTPRDRWVVRGEEFGQDGKSAVWRDPYSAKVVGVVVTLQQVEG